MIRFFKIHLAALVIFSFSLILGVGVHRNYGIAWDEPLQREIGVHSFNYVFNGDKTLNDFKNRDYGVAIELPLIVLEKTLNLTDTRDIYRMRHLVTHLFFLFCAFAFYLLVWFLYRNKPLAIASYLMLLLTPRIYAQSFFNSKDIPFMCMFILCFLAYAIAFRDKKTKYFVLFGVLSGLLINIRIMGIIIPFIVTVLLRFDMVNGPNRRKILINYFVYLAVTIGTLILTWPWLWSDPLGHLKIAFVNMSQFRWPNNVLVYGSFVRATSVGWMYLPHWFGLTTPILYLLLGISGFLFLAIKFIRKPIDFIRSTVLRNQLIYLLCFVGPVAAVIVMHSVLYDAWRQMYFIYPAFLMLAIYGLFSLFNTRFFSSDLPRVAVIVLILLSFAGTGFTMIKSHPFEDVYFNILLPKKDNYLRKTFELDYWGTSYKQALEYILYKDKSQVLYIKVANLAGEHNLFILKSSDQNRIRFVDQDDQADYFITDYRWHPYDYKYPKEKKIFFIRVQNSEICTVWKMK
jgi:hypothetical protein